MGMWKGQTRSRRPQQGIGRRVAPTKPACCGTCQDKLKSCNTQHACCLECHFAFEERHLMPYLPQDLQRELVEQHQWLRRFGFPAVAMDHHSEWEEECYRRYCPAELIEMVERDHDAYDAGQVLSRDKVVGR